MAEKKPWEHLDVCWESLFRPRAEEAYCSFQTVMWILDRVHIDVPVAGTVAGDVPGGRRMVGAWEGLPMFEDKNVKPGVVVARRIERVYHVRLEEGEVHEGRPDFCDRPECLTERVMGE